MTEEIFLITYFPKNYMELYKIGTLKHLIILSIASVS